MMRANQVRMANLVKADRPGLAQPLISPVRLQGQLNPKNPRELVQWAPQGKTLVGGVQWVASIVRPGLAEPQIVAKQDAVGKVEKAAAAEPVASAAPAPAATPKALSGWRRR